MSTLVDKKILFCVSGSIAAYKAADWTRALRKEGADVTVAMTRAGARFVSPLTFAALSGNRVHTDMFAQETAEDIPHINLARKCDCILVAPATAQTIARLAQGLADDLVSTVILAADTKVVVCPAMNSKMYLHPATQENINRLKAFGYAIVEPDCGVMACGEEGPGRLAEWDAVRQALLSALAPDDLLDQKILVSAGPTWEFLDPVRFLSNRSTGKMGYALAATARQRGATVTLVSGPSALSAPPGVEIIRLTTAEEMHAAVLGRAAEMDVIVKAAAVSDYRPTAISDHKIKKGKATMELPLTANPDILKELGGKKKKEKFFPMLVGFAAESRDHREEGLRKLRDKNLDLIVVNDIARPDAGFAVDTNLATLLDCNGAEEELPLLSKEETANRVWDAVIRLQKRAG